MRTLTVMSPDAAADLLARIRGLDFVDGRATAAGAAKHVKSNTQARRSGEGFDQIQAEVLELLAGDARLRDVAFPRQFARILVNRYGVGDTYGMHVDGAFDGSPLGTMTRTDLSYTLFLTPLDEYSGGELQIATPQGMKAFREVPGSMVVYPTAYLHQVTPVKEGERISIVGWIESWVPDAHYRELLTKLRGVQGSIDSGTMNALVKLQLGEVVQDLIRHGSR